MINFIRKTMHMEKSFESRVMESVNDLFAEGYFDFWYQSKFATSEFINKYKDSELFRLIQRYSSTNNGLFSIGVRVRITIKTEKVFRLSITRLFDNDSIIYESNFYYNSMKVSNTEFWIIPFTHENEKINIYTRPLITEQ